ncbi:hypothetical protein D3C78_1305400 [compost metagenome]
MRLSRTVIELGMYFQISLARVQREARCYLRAVHTVDFTYPYRRAPIFIFLQAILYWSERIRTVMLRPVELDASRYPWTGKTDESRLDNTVIVHKIIVIRFIDCAVNPSADFRHNLNS